MSPPHVIYGGVGLVSVLLLRMTLQIFLTVGLVPPLVGRVRALNEDASPLAFHILSRRCQQLAEWEINFRRGKRKKKELPDLDLSVRRTSPPLGSPSRLHLVWTVT
jgi:hypothetical protein